MNRRNAVTVFFVLLAVLFVSCDSKDTRESIYTSEMPVCTVSIDCSAILAHLDDFDSDKLDLIPEDGIILESCQVSFSMGESAADILRRVCEENHIQLETSMTLIYGSVYVEGIGNIYEFDCGQGSGWMYRVNGEYPNYGSGSYAVSPGDIVEWKYTCDFGVDIGGGNQPFPD